jgi:ornithine cyclodeaminase
MDACRPLALISTKAFNGHRTASGFAAAARVLAPVAAKSLALFGAGHLAPWTVKYLLRVRPIERVTIVSRRLEQARQLVDQLAREPVLKKVSFTAEADRSRAVGDADIIAAVTSADEPVFPGELVRRGALVILGGANRPSAREADDLLLSRTTMFLDHYAGCLEKAGDVRLGLARGVLDEARIAGEIGKLLAGKMALPPHDVMAFKSIGIAPQDLSLARHIFEEAERTGAGVLFDPSTGELER